MLGPVIPKCRTRVFSTHMNRTKPYSDSYETYVNAAFLVGGNRGCMNTVIPPKYAGNFKPRAQFYVFFYLLDFVHQTSP